jgi:PAS domain S-box-containing protein
MVKAVAHDGADGFASILKSIGEGIIATDRQGTISYMNQTAMSFTGWGVAEALGHALNEVFVITNRSGTNKVFDAVVAEVRATEQSVDLTDDLLLTSRDGRERLIRARIDPLLTDEPDTRGAVIVFRDISKCRATREATSEKDKLYRIAFENSAEGLMLTDAVGGILDANPAACRILGYNDKEELLTLQREDIIDMTDPHLPVYLEQRKHQGYASGELTMLAKGGIKILTEASSQLFYSEKGELRASFIFRDITERKRMEAALQRYAKRMEVLHQIDLGLIQGESIPTLVETTLKYIRQIIPCQRAQVSLRDPDTGEALVFALDLNGKTMLGSNVRTPLPPDAFEGYDERHVKIYDDLRPLQEINWRVKHLLSEGLVSNLSVLLTHQDKPLGLLALFADKLEFFTAEYQEIAAEIASQLAIAINQMYLSQELAQQTVALEQHVTELQQAETALQRYNQRLEILHQIDMGLIQGKSIQDLVEATLKYIRQLIPCQRASVIVLDPDTDGGIYFAIDVNDSTSLQPGFRIPIPPQVLEGYDEQHMRVVDDLRLLPKEYPMIQQFIDEGFYSSINVKLVIQDKLIGGLGLLSDKLAFFTADYQNIAVEIASQLAIAINQMNLSQELKQRAAELELRVSELRQAEVTLQRYNQRLEILHQIDIGLIQSGSVKALTEITLKHIRQLIPCQRASVMLFDQTTGEGIIFAANFSGETSLLQGIRIPNLPPNTLKDFNARNIRVIEDLRLLPDPPPLIKQLISEGLLTALNVLLTNQERAFGILGLFADIPGFFAAEYQDIAVEIASQLAIAINQMNLTQELQRYNEQLRQSEVALRQSEEMYRLLARNLPDSDILIFDRGMRYLIAEGGALSKRGISREELEGKTLQEVMQPEDVTRLLPYYQAALAGLENTFEDYYSDRIYLVRAVPIKNELGNITAGMLFSEDITALKKAEQILADEKEQLAVTLRSIGDGVITTDLTGKITLLNRAAEDLTGWYQPEAIGRPLTDIFQIIDELTRQPQPNPVDETLSTGQITALRNHTILIARDGSERVIADSCAPIRDQLSRVIGTVLVFRDITVQQRMTEEMQKTSRLEALGVLAGGIAHDFNNLLSGIIGFLDLARLSLENESKHKPVLEQVEIESFVEEAEKAALRAKDLTLQLLTFAKGGEPVKKTARLTQTIQDAASFALHGSNVQGVFELETNLWPVEVDAGQIGQVIQNLVLNATQAMPEGGTITVKAENITLEAGAEPTLEAGQYIRLLIQDEGIGIPAENLAKIFDPYFTTKPAGNGLGLAVCYSIIKKHGGLLTVESEIGHGTTFHIYLPVSENLVKEEIKKTRAKPKIVTSDSPLKLLVMDDEPILQELAKRTLQRLGHQIEIARHGQEAIQLYEAAFNAGQPFDLVLLDLTIPGGMGGKQTIARLLELDPQVKAVVCSGYSSDPIMSNYREHGFVDVLLKPYRMEELRKVLERVRHG